MFTITKIEHDSKEETVIGHAATMREAQKLLEEKIGSEPWLTSHEMNETFTLQCFNSTYIIK